MTTETTVRTKTYPIVKAMPNTIVIKVKLKDAAKSGLTLDPKLVNSLNRENTITPDKSYVVHQCTALDDDGSPLLKQGDLVRLRFYYVQEPDGTMSGKFDPLGVLHTEEPDGKYMYIFCYRDGVLCKVEAEVPLNSNALAN